jgi:hypothetical protein
MVGLPVDWLVHRVEACAGVATWYGQVMIVRADPNRVEDAVMDARLNFGDFRLLVAAAVRAWPQATPA